MGFRLGRRRRGSNIDQKTFLFFYLFIFWLLFCLFFVAENSKPPVELMAQSAAGAWDKVSSLQAVDGASQRLRDKRLIRSNFSLMYFESAQKRCVQIPKRSWNSYKKKYSAEQHIHILMPPVSQNHMQLSLALKSIFEGKECLSLYLQGSCCLFSNHKAYAGSLRQCHTPESRSGKFVWWI